MYYNFLAPCMSYRAKVSNITVHKHTVILQSKGQQHHSEFMYFNCITLPYYSSPKHKESKYLTYFLTL